MAFSADQNVYADVVQKLGEKPLVDGRTLSESLVLEGMPFWDVFAPENAWRHMTTAIATDTFLEKTKYFLKPSAMFAREAIKRLILNRSKGPDSLSQPNNPVVLCMGLTPRMYRDVLQDVTSYIAGNSDYHMVVLGESSKDIPHSTPTGTKIENRVIWHYWDQEALVIEKKLIQSLEDLKREVLSTKALRELAKGFGGRPLEYAVFKMLTLFLKCYLPQIFGRAALTYRILKRHKPALVLSADTSDSRTRLYTLAAGKMGIPTLEVQFGLAGEEAVEWRFFAADNVAVWGEVSQKVLAQHGVKPEKILLTGSPRYDYFYRSLTLATDHTKYRSRLGIRDNCKVILLASTYVDKTHSQYARPEVLIEMKRSLFDGVRGCHNLVMVVKPHPHENVKETRMLAGQAKNIVFADKTSDIRELIALSDAFVSFGSTATVDAWVAQKLTICPIFPGWEFSENFRSSGAVCVVESQNGINDVFLYIASGKQPEGKALRDIARVRYLEKILCKLDGQATSRIGNHAIRLAGQNLLLE